MGKPSPSHGSPLWHAEKLLLSYLTPAQRKTYLDHHYIDVTAGGGRIYRVRCGGFAMMNVTRVTEDGSQVYRRWPYGGEPMDYCFVVRERDDWREGRRGDRLPLPDQWLAQVMFLKLRERTVWQIANR